jgi:uncharacterized phage protein (TIGR02218 family)
LVEASLNGEDFSTVSKGGAIPGLTASDDLTTVSVTFKVTLTAASPLAPTFSALTVQVVGQGAALTGANDHYNFGQLTWLTGGNAGSSIEVKRWNATSRQVVLFLPMPFDLAVGDTFTILPGCDKTIGTCNTKFSNVLNFRGEPHVPGVDEYQRYPDAR